MKALKILSFFLITIIFSSCYFLDHFIPEEYFADDETTIISQKEYSEFVWIIHRPENSNDRKFSSLSNAIDDLINLDVVIYDWKKYSIAHTNIKKDDTHKSSKSSYSALIKSIDLTKLKNTNWYYWYNAK